jgi:hypothetical protein
MVTTAPDGWINNRCNQLIPGKITIISNKLYLLNWLGRTEK